MKNCSKCNQIKPFEDFHRDSTAKTGFRSRCKLCCAEDSAIRYSKNPEKHIEISKRWQSKNKERVIEYRKERYKTNSDGFKEISRQYRLKNPQKIKEYNRSYYQENKEREKLRAKIYRQLNPEKCRDIQRLYLSSNKSQVKAARKKYRQSKPEIFQRINQNRRARKLLAQGKLSPGLAKKLYVMQKGKCACCKKILGNNYHMDHIMPLALGGSNTDDNIQLLRAQCNNQKYSKHPVDFMQERGYLL